ncbi:MAG: zinc-ribbon domain-containing protein, partial [Blautia sp.]|nr:zinc-ribbon domain-containing protein [Blautia sp.]
MKKDPLSITHPEIAAEWSERNGNLTPDMVTYGSNDKVWWKGKCGHEWKTSVTIMLVYGKEANNKEQTKSSAI